LNEMTADCFGHFKLGAMATTLAEQLSCFHS
jgi:hypothetical protein